MTTTRSGSKRTALTHTPVRSRSANGFWPSPIFAPVSSRPPSLSNHRAPGERAAALAASWCTRRLGRAYAQPAWQILADAARRGVIRYGRPEAWAAGAVAALARGNGLLGPERALTAQQIADELDVKLGALAVTERELTRALNLARYAHRPPHSTNPDSWRTAYARDPER